MRQVGGYGEGGGGESLFHPVSLWQRHLNHSLLFSQFTRISMNYLHWHDFVDSISICQCKWNTFRGTLEERYKHKANCARFHRLWMKIYSSLQWNSHFIKLPCKIHQQVSSRNEQCFDRSTRESPFFQIHSRHKGSQKNGGKFYSQSHLQRNNGDHQKTSHNCNTADPMDH